GIASVWVGVERKRQAIIFGGAVTFVIWVGGQLRINVVIPLIQDVGAVCNWLFTEGFHVFERYFWQREVCRVAETVREVCRRFFQGYLEREIVDDFEAR